MKKILAVLFAVILVICVTAEIGVRSMVGKELRQNIATNSGLTEQDPQPSVSFGPTPLLFSAVTKNVPKVEIDVPSTLNPQSGTGNPETHIKVKSLNIADNANPIAQNLTLATSMPTDYLLAQAQQASSQGILGDLVKVSAMRTDAARNVLIVELAQGSATLEISPRAENGQLILDASNASILGFDLPPEVSDAISQSLRVGANEFGGELRTTKVEVVENGVNLELEGENVNISQLQQPAQPPAPVQ
ncbi:LmeA family phospholipid-binding protein [Corynebacterium freiburgense]|uniref:LmeA family phospholipid-binding protein n=1 Tax=Corynebacterium freiburgense TaxID=556548 RepID=UPI0004113A62|nr:LmeA family phospholipid-binding protein [Corynebacterium freiburgense]WJZ01528.1 hypothetical protein CFREI_01100 [Corynebacterium freiburgense]